MTLVNQTIHAQLFKDNFYVRVLSEELHRNIDRLHLPDLEKPFFIAYTLRNQFSFNLNAERGIITSTVKMPVNNKFASVKLRVGDYHRNFDYMLYDNYIINMPNEMDVDEYKRLLWLETDKAYKNNARQYSGFISALKRVNVDENELAIDDLSKIHPVIEDYGGVTPIDIDTQKWEQYLCQLSSLFNEYPDITTSYCRLVINSYEDYLITSEGSIIRKPNESTSFIAYGSVMDNRGGNYSDTYKITVKNISELPPIDVLEKEVKKIIATIKQKQSSKPFEGSYVGPVLFTEIAIPEIIDQCFVNTLHAKRKSILGYNNGEANYEEKLGQKLIASELSVTAIPSLSTFEGKKTTGFYQIDDEGVKPPDSLVLIDKGILQSLLNGRTPTKKFPTSQGFARVFAGRTYSAGVLQFSANKVAHADSMKQILLQIAKEEGLHEAYIVKEYNYRTPKIYRINVVTGEEDMVEGGSIMPLHIRSFRRFVVASDKMQLHNAADFSILAPQSIILNEVEIEKSQNTTKPKPIIVSNPLLERESIIKKQVHKKRLP